MADGAEGSWAGPEGVVEVSVEGAAAPAPALGSRRYVTWSPQVAEAVRAAVEAGLSIPKACVAPGMPHPTSVYEWGRTRPEFGAALGAAHRAARMKARLEDRAKAVAKLAAGRDNRGRWSTFTPEMGEEVCLRIADAESLKAIGADPAMPCAATVLKWAREIPDFGDAYALARLHMADVLFDEAREVALAATPASERADRLRFDTIRWLTARLAPRKYCERVMAEAQVAARRAEDDPERGGVTVILKHFSDITPEEEAAHDETERRYAALERSPRSRG